MATQLNNHDDRTARVGEGLCSPLTLPPKPTSSSKRLNQSIVLNYVRYFHRIQNAKSIFNQHTHEIIAHKSLLRHNSLFRFISLSLSLFLELASSLAVALSLCSHGLQRSLSLPLYSLIPVSLSHSLFLLHTHTLSSIICGVLST